MTPLASFPASGFMDLKMSALAGIRPLLQDFGLFCEILEHEVLPEEMVHALEPTLELARDTYCPVKTGELRDSGYVESRAYRGNVTAEIGFGKGGMAPYAVFVHENPNMYHAPPTQYKYLERAVYEDSHDVMDRLYSSVKGRMRL